MYKCEIENSKKNIITLTQNESNYQIINIEGLNPPNAQINLSTIAGLDGAKFNSSILETRNIVIYVKLNGEIEKNRINLYNYVPTKDWCKFYYENENRNVYIDCYVESVEVNPFSNNEIMQISLICPQPYFKDLDEIISDISKVLNAFKFPFSINENEPIPISIIENNRITNVYNNSESETGLIITVEVLGKVNKILIRNTGTGDTFTINNTDGFIAGDTITINTNKGEKSVTLSRNGAVNNLFGKLVFGSIFFQLSIGDNLFSYLIDNGANDDKVHVNFKHRTIYRGV